MHYIALISATLLASAAASAIPGTTPVSVNALTKREEKVWDPKGNIKLTFSQETVKIGDLNIDAIIHQLAAVCHESGQCETNEIEMKSRFWKSENNHNLKVTLGPHGTYPVWIRNGLVDLLGVAVKAIAKCTSGTYTNTCPGVTAMAYCPRKKTQYTNCEVPQFWGITYQTADSANAAPPAISVDLASENSDAAVCKDALEITGTVAGAVNGYAGTAFTLLSYACGA
ncbi:hypothetical protein HBI70_199300 [Parastagonospora nodorum]|nr:hypothetical protein HBH50_218900 [Parastagonospora nodorum]KAH4080078.1 hypothetical protein HBH48_211550 [Parastagonospora nodorum]KAH4156410.1 hypothetical protein HBH43_207430 [Parastagonospora nodorum]KAH4599221.1 hypothetical protein HBH82_208560 [Parastagonospora nodorum]KAH4668563.1 hypothetical protein HBH78_191460 [Parastagonospora nodorum]